MTDKKKYYFFRDLENDPNSEGNLSFHAAGIVIDYSVNFLGSEKVMVTFKNPFNGDEETQFRAKDEIELFEVSEIEYNALVDTLDE